MAKIIITIAEDSTTTVAVNGVKGKSCTGLTKALEKALGQTTKDRKGPEYYEKSRQTQRAGQ